ncbi:hypothetical protein FNV43_RR17888 [Rhamnella rubrinervis]|uniref:DUF4408 domain-containing protein n=1 Tax=Rhamnella rubrinervis TaxID=2594499 RepID=A0A8K0DYD7_9ROSA|nr:hypothetical protein FNV43_RR17888 [Rhamnella rubrinervis]
MASWLTPTYLFLFLNLVIGTIFLISRLKPHHHQHDHPGPYNSPQLARAPSLLERVKSIDFSFYKFDQPTPPETEFNPPQTTQPGSVTHYVQDHQPPLVRTPSLLDRLKSINLSSLYNRSETEVLEAARAERRRVDLDPNQSTDHDDHLVKRSKSDSSSGDATSSQHPEKIKKSVSEISALGKLVVDEVMERPVPATTRVEKWSDKRTSVGEDQGVDAKADDFINKFKQQLRLQRLDSLKRFGDMLKGKQS